VLLRLAISLATLATSSDSERDLEILTLRHQVAVLRRQVKGAGTRRLRRAEREAKELSRAYHTLA
jgi:hypothetical protein